MASLHAQFSKLAKAIYNIYDARIDEISNVFVETGQKMIIDFRQIQYASPQIENSRKNEADTTEKKNKARQFAKKFENTTVITTRGVPWFNRSFRAARSVYPYVDKNSDNIAVGLCHTMSYGAYLEFAYNRKYATLEPIVRSYSQELIDKIKNVMAGANE